MLLTPSGFHGLGDFFFYRQRLIPDNMANRKILLN